MATVLEDALVLARPEAAAHGARIDLEVDPELPAVFGDRIQLQQVVLNLVRNSIDAIVEAGGPQGRIAVRAILGAGGRTVEVSVADLNRDGTGEIIVALRDDTGTSIRVFDLRNPGSPFQLPTFNGFQQQQLYIGG